MCKKFNRRILTLDYLYYITVATIGLCSIVAILKYRNLIYYLKPIAYLSTFSFLTEVVAYIFAEKFHNNLWVYAIACPIEFGCYSLLFSNIIEIRKISMIIKSIWILFSLTTIIILIFYPSILLGGRLDVIAMSICCSIYCIIYYFNIFNHLDIRIELNKLIPITGMLFYFSFTSIYWTIYLNFNTSFLSDFEPFLLISICLEYISLIVALNIKTSNSIDN